MKAYACQPKDGKSVLAELELPCPIAKPHEVVVSVRAAGVTPTELLWYPTTHNEDGSVRKDAVPGHEFSGEIAALGEQVSRFQVGDAVLGMSDWFANGATAQFCVAEENSIVPKPPTLTHVSAAAMPIAALTAWQGLVERARVRSGDRVLIVGASGSVGLMAVQVAALHGCVVFGSASAAAGPELKSLGCQEVFDFHSQPFEEHLRDIDVVFDTVGGDTLARAETVLAPQGRMITIAADAEGNRDPAIKTAFFIVKPSVPQLEQILQLWGKGRLKAFVKAVLPLHEAPQAYSGEVHASGLGKLVLEVERS